MADVVYTGFDPEFGKRLDRLIALAKAEGYDPSLISGTRSAYGWPGMKGESQADLYAKRGTPGGPRRVAAPGYSPHQYGVAGDVTGIPQSELERLSQQVGLRAIHDDPNHVELANWQQEASTQPRSTPWTQVADVPSEYAMNASTSTSTPSGGSFAPPPGKTLNSNAIVETMARNIAGIESGGQKNPYEALGPDVGGRRGRAVGKYQVMPENIPGWTLAATGHQMTPDEFKASPEAQEAVIRDQLRRGLQLYGPRDVASIYFTGKPFNVSGGAATDKYTTNANYATRATAGLDSAAPAPSGQGGIGSDAVASGQAAGAKAPPSWQDVAKAFTAPGAGGAASPLEALTKGIEGGAGQQQDSGGGQQASQLQAQQAAAPLQQARQQALASSGQQLMAQILAQGRKPLSWNSRPPGSMMGAGAGQGPAATDPFLAQLMQQGGAMGTTLNSIGDDSYG